MEVSRKMAIPKILPLPKQEQVAIVSKRSNTYFRGMGKDKLRRFNQNETFDHVIQPTRQEVMQGLPMAGQWGKQLFKNNNPIVLELGCGHGDYTVGLARLYPNKNFIGIDIKGARIWKGANTAKEEGLSNVAFLRTEIELINFCFAHNEVSEIWITFPDPQIKYRRAKHRLTHPAFLEKYKGILNENGKIHLKCDSEFLHGYTSGLVHLLGYKVYASFYDIDLQLRKNDPNNVLFSIQTHYEKKWLKEGKAITYLCFSPSAE